MYPSSYSSYVRLFTRRARYGVCVFSPEVTNQNFLLLLASPLAGGPKVRNRNNVSPCLSFPNVLQGETLKPGGFDEWKTSCRVRVSENAADGSDGSDADVCQHHVHPCRLDHLLGSLMWTAEVRCQVLGLHGKILGQAQDILLS